MSREIKRRLSWRMAYWMDGPGFDSRWGGEVFHNRPEEPRSPSGILCMQEIHPVDISPILSSITIDWCLAPHRWGFYITHSDAPQSVGLLWTSGQLVAETSTWQHTTLTTDKLPCRRWDSNHDLSRRAAVDLRLRPRGHWDRPLKQNGVKQTTVKRGWTSRGNSNFCSEIHTEHKHSLCGQKAELFES